MSVPYLFKKDIDEVYTTGLLQALPTFAAYDVLKNPDIDNDLRRFEAHLQANIHPKRVA